MSIRRKIRVWSWITRMHLNTEKYSKVHVGFRTATRLRKEGGCQLDDGDVRGQGRVTRLPSLTRLGLGYAGADKGMETLGQILWLEPQLCCPLNGLG